uniref:Transmembrane protein n=1 Tax=Chionoecetes opilio bacilliform virus TaxID=1825681 RepID=A0A1Q3DKV1_9VIRU|nr:wsv025-like protein [Chionoecetes opilio bacilliform virus]GAV93157.1 hypothetical protein SCV_033 [Chionoecetes opilio bacilliform virus]
MILDMEEKKIEGRLPLITAVVKRKEWSKAVNLSRQRQQRQKKKTSCKGEVSDGQLSECCSIMSMNKTVPTSRKKKKYKVKGKKKRKTKIYFFFKGMTPIQRIKFISLCIAAGFKLTAILLAVVL